MPVRTCVGCRTRAETTQLLRVVRDGDATLVVDRRASGRGAWLCRAAEGEAIRASCLDLAQRRQSFSRAFRSPVAAAAVEALRES